MLPFLSSSFLFLVSKTTALTFFSPCLTSLHIITKIFRTVLERHNLQPVRSNSKLLLFDKTGFARFNQFSSVAQSWPTLRPHELQHTRPPCPSPTPRPVKYPLVMGTDTRVPFTVVADTLRGQGGGTGKLLIQSSVLQNENRFGDGWWWWLRGNVNVLYALELYT